MLFKVSQEEFAFAVVKAAAALGVQSRFDRDSFSLSFGDGRALQLANAYAEYSAAPLWQRQGVVKRYGAVIKEMSAPQELTKDQTLALLKPRVRERAYLEMAKLLLRSKGGGEASYSYRVIGGGQLTVEVVIDLPRSMESVGQDRLAEWSLSLDDSLAIARENMIKPGARPNFEAVRPGLFQSRWRDNYDVSRMLYEEFFNGLAIKGRPVAMVPNRDVLLITGADDVDGLVRMGKIAEEVLADPRPMTGIAFRLDSGWAPYLPPRNHPAFRPLELLALQTRVREYTQQHELLSTIFKAEGNDVFIAQFMAHTTPKEDIVTTSVLTDGIDSLLPRTDQVSFVRPPKNGAQGYILGTAPWDRVATVLGKGMETTGYYPERYRVRIFPTEEQLAAMEMKSGAPEAASRIS